MKTTSAHVALLAVLMYGLLAATHLYGQPRRSPAAVSAAPTASDSDSNSKASDPDLQANEYRTIHVKYAEASFLAKQLKDLVPMFTIVIGDDRTNQLIIRGRKDGIETTESLIKQLDVPDADGPKNTNFGFGIAKPAMPRGPSATAKVLGGPKTSHVAVKMSSDWVKAWQDYTALTGDETPVQKAVLAMRDQLEQAKVSGNSDAARELENQINHLLGEQARRAAEQAQRAAEMMGKQLSTEEHIRSLENYRNNEKLSPAEREKNAAELQQAREALHAKTSNSPDDQSAEQARIAAEDARRAAEKAKRTIEAVQRAMQVAVPQYYSDLQLEKLVAEYKKLAATENPSDEQQRELDAQKSQLKEVLSTQFDVRQKAESEELKRLRERLDKLEKDISDRAQNRDEFINRRLKELMSSSADSAAGVSTVNVSELTGEDLQGAGHIQFQLTSPGTITITKPVPPAPPVAPVPPVKADVHVSTKVGKMPPPAEPNAAKSSDAVTPPEPADSPASESSDSKEPSR
ncbi:MAG TPA: secretin N-terminal domain-containing protein, partial [Pirellulales bacterium]